MREEVTASDRNLYAAAGIVAILRATGPRWLDVLAIVCRVAIEHADRAGLTAHPPPPSGTVATTKGT